MKWIISYCLMMVFLRSCGVNQFPKTMPDDFKIKYQFNGGMINEHRNILLQVGECKDEGRKNDSDFTETFILTDKADMEPLYAALRNIHAFTLNFRTENDIHDRGGESVDYTINGKTYHVSNSGLDFIDKEDAPAFSKSMFLIKEFLDSFKDKYLKKDSLVEDVLTLEIDSNVPPDNSQPTSKLPTDFTIQYDYEAGMTGDHQTIILKLGNCSVEGNKLGEDFQSKKWNNDDKTGFEKLYLDLEKLHAFDIKYNEKGKVYDRGGENLTFTINGKKRFVKNAGNCFVEPTQADAFKKAVKLILNYASKSSK